MAITTTLERKNASGSQSTTYSYSFPLYQSTDLSVKVLDAGTWATKILDTHYTHDSTAKTIQFKEGQVPTSGDNTILLERVTDLDVPKADYAPGTAIKAADLDNNSKQERYASEELHSRAADVLNPTFYGNVTFASTQTFDGRDASVDGAKLDGIEASATADQTAAEIRTLVESATDSNVFTDADHSKLNAIEASADVTDATNVDAAGAVMNSDASTAAMSFVVDEDNFASDSATKVPTQQSVKAYIGTTNYTKTESDSKYYKKTGSPDEVIKSSETWPTDGTKDDFVVTPGSVDLRVVALVEEVGGFVAIDNETSFPNTNPDVNDGAGTIVSIKSLASAFTSSGSGVATIANGTLGNSTVTINGLANNTTYGAGLGLLVETTTTLNTYKFHRQTPLAADVAAVAAKSTEVGRLGTTDAVADMALLGTTDCVADMALLGTTDAIADMNTLATSDVIDDLDKVATIQADVTKVADIDSNVTTVANNNSNVTAVATNIADVENFADVYQIKTSAPTERADSSSLALGDLWFDSSSNKVMMVYDGSSGDGYSATSPSQSVLNDIANVSGQLTYKEDLGGIADSLTTETGNNINTVATNINNINSFSEQYKVASGQPSGAEAGDLWYDTTANKLKYHNGTAFTVTAAAGLSAVSDDTSPALGGHLDCNDKNLTEVGTVSGDNLQIDFGAIA